MINKLFICAILGITYGTERAFIREEMVEYLHQHAKTWTPLEVSENPFAGLTLEEVKARAGAHSYDSLEGVEEFSRLKSTPENFDGRQEWGSCVHPIRDQASCGSCWAFGSSESLSDRFCIDSNGAIDVVLSPQYQVSCDSEQKGCGGGWLGSTWNFLQETGTVLDSCVSYKSGRTGTDYDCPNACDDGSPLEHYRCGTVESAQGQELMKSMILEGPVEVQFHTFEDFYHYASGIYTRTSLHYITDHDVKVLGWGYDSASGLNYWIAANSWGNTWGEKGFFRIAFGECGFDDLAYSCIPDLSSPYLLTE